MKILFLCTGNAVRSQMAEGWARHLAPEAVEARSAGIFPSQVHPLAIEVMQQAGVDISGHVSRLLDDTLLGWADCVVTVCDTVKLCRSLFPDKVTHHHWSIANPDDLIGDDLTPDQAYTLVRDEIRWRVEELLAGLIKPTSGSAI